VNVACAAIMQRSVILTPRSPSPITAVCRALEDARPWLSHAPPALPSAVRSVVTGLPLDVLVASFARACCHYCRHCLCCRYCPCRRYCRYCPCRRYCRYCLCCRYCRYCLCCRSPPLPRPPATRRFAKWQSYGWSPIAPPRGRGDGGRERGRGLAHRLVRHSLGEGGSFSEGG